MAETIGATTRVSSINGGATGNQRHGLRGAAVILQRTEHWIGVVQIAWTIEIAGVVAAEVVAVGGHGAVAVSRIAVSDDAVLECHRVAAEGEDAAAEGRSVPADGDVAHR